MARRLARAMSTSGFDLKDVIELHNLKELGRGAYGRVYAVKYCQTICAAKEIHPILVEGVEQEDMQCTIDSFIKECQQCSTLHHPNIVQFLGVYYPTRADMRSKMPVMVMEMMADSLALFVDKHGKIPVHIKYSIVYDVSLGLCYLHSRNPPIVHRDLSPNNVLLTAHHVAKISDLGVAKVIKADTSRMTVAPGTADFMPPEARANSPVYGPPMDVFSYAGIILHTFNQQWPKPTEQVQFDLKTRKMIALSEVERRQQYLDKMTGAAIVLRSLTEECLQYVPAERPTIANVHERIQGFWTAYKKKSTSPQQCITLYQENVQQKTEIQQLKHDNEQFKNENERLKNENEQFKYRNGRLKDENDRKGRIIEQLRNEKEQLRATVEQMVINYEPIIIKYCLYALFL